MTTFASAEQMLDSLPSTSTITVDQAQKVRDTLEALPGADASGAAAGTDPRNRWARPDHIWGIRAPRGVAVDLYYHGGGARGENATHVTVTGTWPSKRRSRIVAAASEGRSALTALRGEFERMPYVLELGIIGLLLDTPEVWETDERRERVAALVDEHAASRTPATRVGLFHAQAGLRHRLHVDHVKALHVEYDEDAQGTTPWYSEALARELAEEANQHKYSIFIDGEYSHGVDKIPAPPAGMIPAWGRMSGMDPEVMWKQPPVPGVLGQRVAVVRNWWEAGDPGIVSA